MIDALGAVNEISTYKLPEDSQKVVSAGSTVTGRSGVTGGVSATDPYDLNGDGVLSYDELMAYLEAMGLLQTASSTELELGDSGTVSADTATAAYRVHAGSREGSNLPGLSREMAGESSYTPIDLMV